jgi:hypothetical protein
MNEKWRIVYRWLGDDAHDIAIGDYHKNGKIAAGCSKKVF